MADSDYTPDEALVEALAAVVFESIGPIPWDNLCEKDAEGAESCREAARDFLTTHRLVSLPSEPKWEVEWDDDGDCPRWSLTWNRDHAEALAVDDDFATTGRIRPVYTIHGEPIDLTRPTDTGTDPR